MSMLAQNVKLSASVKRDVSEHVFINAANRNVYSGINADLDDNCPTFEVKMPSGTTRNFTQECEGGSEQEPAM